MSVNVDASDLECLRALGEPLRWRIAGLLAGEELCVCHLVEELGVPQSLVSHHLRVLRDAGVVEAERFRYWTYYRIRPPALAALAEHLGGLAAGSPAPGTRRRACC
jgi:ArsR family transcriptional regulator, arsenate/arsenite/antimonite-responsive transcriptional repressor